MGDLHPEFQGTWFNLLDPFYGYLKIEPYKGEDEGGEAIAIIHAKHGLNESPIWYRGTWKPTDLGWEVICGPYHWKEIAMFTTPETRDTPYVLQYFRSQLNGYGACNMGKLGEKEEQEFVDSLGTELPSWQDERTYWKDYPNATWPESKKYVRPIHTFDGGGTPPSLMPDVPPEDQITHNGGQLTPPQTGQKNPPPPVGPPSGGGGDKPGGGDGGGEDGGGDENPPPKPEPGPPGPDGPAPPPKPGGPSGDEQPQADGEEQPADGEQAPKKKGWISGAVDSMTDVVDTITGGASEGLTGAVDDAVDKGSKAFGDFVSGAAETIYGSNSPAPPPPPEPSGRKAKKPK